jgi:hypothetical protein
VLAHPHGAAVLRPGVASDFLSGLLLPDIPYAQLLVSARRDQHGSIVAPRQRLDDVVMFEVQFCGTAFDVPDLDSVVARRASQYVLRGGVEEDVPNFPTLYLASAIWHASTTETNLMWPESRALGETSAGSSPSE